MSLCLASLSLFFPPSLPSSPSAVCPSAPTVVFLRLSEVLCYLEWPSLTLPLALQVLERNPPSTAHPPSTRTAHCAVAGQGSFKYVLPGSIFVLSSSVPHTVAPAVCCRRFLMSSGASCDSLRPGVTFSRS